MRAYVRAALSSISMTLRRGVWTSERRRKTARSRRKHEVEICVAPLGSDVLAVSVNLEQSQNHNLILQNDTRAYKEILTILFLNDYKLAMSWKVAQHKRHTFF